MTIDISEGVLVGMVGGFFTILGKILWSVGSAIIASLKSGDAAREKMVESQKGVSDTQTKILDRVTELAQATGAAKNLDAIKRAIARSNPSLLFCDVCQGWEGPDIMRPTGVKSCICSERPPPPSKV